MKLSLKIVIIWTGIVIIYALSALVFPHQQTPVAATTHRVIQSLLFVLSVFLYQRDPNRRNKFIFLNFVVYYSVVFLAFFYEFISPDWFPQNKYVTVFYFQYLSIGYTVALAIAVCYLAVDLLFSHFRVYQKYIFTFALVLPFVGFLFYPFFKEPLFLYSTESIKQWKQLSTFVGQSKEAPSSLELASTVTLHTWREGVAVGDLYPEANQKRIEELVPYLEGENWMVILWEPLYLKTIYTNMFLVGLILLFFGYQYKKDPPQGAYIDKIMFMLLLMSSMDILHNWGYIRSVEWGSMTELFAVAQYVFVSAELLMVVFFILRLRFISSVQGEFYELEIAENPNQISRWRDWVDNLVLSHFFSAKSFKGRLFQATSGNPQQNSQGM